MSLDEAILQEARRARDRLLDLQHETERMRADFEHAVRRLHAAGAPLREIGECLGLSHQRVHQIVDAGSDSAPGRRRAILREAVKGRARKAVGDVFQRFTKDARQVVVLAQEEARALGHNYIGTEHLLLGLLRVEDGVAARALASLGFSLETTRASVTEVVGRGEEQLGGAMPFTPRSKKALELALREARRLGHDYIGTEHVLLGLVRDDEGIAAELLANAGAGRDAVRAAVTELLEAA